MTSAQSPEPRAQTGLYVHVPFCRKRCPYCAFTLIESDGSLHERFTAKIERQVRGLDPRTLYFGGGTPSMLAPEQLARMIVGRPEEITVECNPEGMSLDGLREIGVNRITLGIQALDDGLLRTLGREHDADGARRAWREASAKFDNICVDLIFGVPGQTLEGWKATLAEVVAWSPAHVSLYGLTYEEGTPFEKIKDRLPEERERDMYLAAMDALAEYHHYEISNFARPGFESKHNSSYWEGRPYLGFGPGAHSFDGRDRWWNIANVRQWLEREDVEAARETLSPEQVRIERLLLGLRTDRGVEFDEIPRNLERYLERHDGRVRLTREGRCVADSVIARLI